MNLRKLKLEGEGGDLHISVDERGWAECRLLNGDSNIFLGAEEIHTLADRLCSKLADEGGEAAGEVGGRRVRWVASLSESHHTLYFYMDEGDRVLVWQDAGAKVVATMRLSGERCRAWQVQLRAAIGDGHEI
jgi:hypothetical protein